MVDKLGSSILMKGAEHKEVKPMTEKVVGTNPVEAIEDFIKGLPKSSPRGLLSPEATKEEIATAGRYARMETLLRVAQLRLSTLSYLGAANEYIELIGEEDKTIARAFQVVIAAEAMQDIVNIHSDLEIMRVEARKLYTDAGLQLPVDALTGTLDALAKLVKASVDKSTLAKPVEG